MPVIGKLLKLYWEAPESHGDKVRLLGMLALTLGNVYLNIQFNYWKNDFYTALQNYRYDEVMRQMVWFMELAALAILVSMYLFYLRKVITLHWRNHLSRAFIGRWVDENGYYFTHFFHAGADNPDQRISDDIRLFIEGTLEFSFGVLNAVLTFVSFVSILWTLSGVIYLDLPGFTLPIHGYIVWAAFLYAIAGTYITYTVGKKLPGLNYNQQMYEADLRADLVRLKEYAESIVMSRQGRAVKKNLLGDLASALGNYYSIIQKERNVTAVQSGYFQAANIIPVLVAVPLYMKGTLNLGGLMQSASAFGRVAGSLSYFIRLYSNWAEWQSVIERLSDFIHHIETVAQKRKDMRKTFLASDEGEFAAKEVKIQKMDGTTLVYVGSLSLTKGTRILVTGENGVGKSLFVKSLLGLWPYYEGVIYHPEAAKIAAISQKPYIPFGSLSDFLGIEAGDMKRRSEAFFWMKIFLIESLAVGIDEEKDWSQILSMGEMQKLMIIRAVLDKPEWLFMDEATSGIDTTAEMTVYSSLVELLPGTGIISVAHRPHLRQFHQEEWRIKDGSFYEVK